MDILEESNDKSLKDYLIDDNLDGIVSNMETVQRTPRTTNTVAPKRSSKKEQNNDDMVRSPQKSQPNHKLMNRCIYGNRGKSCRCIKGMTKEWYNKNGKTTLPPDLAVLALWVGINPTDIVPSYPTTPRRGKGKKAATPSAWDRAVKGSLLGRRFVLSGMWPNLEEEAGLKSGEERAKSCIELFGGKVTLANPGLTDALIIGEKPGDKKLTQVHEKEVKVIDSTTLNHLITGELSLDKVQMKYASAQGASVQMEDHPLQYQSQTHMPTEQVAPSTVG